MPVDLDSMVTVPALTDTIMYLRLLNRQTSCPLTLILKLIADPE